jgi:hypothetical protein
MQGNCTTHHFQHGSNLNPKLGWDLGASGFSLATNVVPLDEVKRIFRLAVLLFACACTKLVLSEPVDTLCVCYLARYLQHDLREPATRSK